KTFLERACFAVVGIAFDELPRMLARRGELAGIAFESREREEDVPIARMPCQRRDEHANRGCGLAGLVQREGISVAECRDVWRKIARRLQRDGGLRRPIRSGPREAQRVAQLRAPGKPGDPVTEYLFCLLLGPGPPQQLGQVDVARREVRTEP